MLFIRLAVHAQSLPLHKGGFGSVHPYTREQQFLRLMVVMMVAMGISLKGVQVAAGVMAMFIRGFQLQRGMADAVLCQFLPNLLLDPVGIPAAFNVHGGAVTFAIQTADVQVVNVGDTFNGG